MTRPLKASASELRTKLFVKNGNLLYLVLLICLCNLDGCLGQSDLHIRYNSTLGRTHLRGIRRIPSNLYTTRATPVAEDDPIEASSELKVRAVAPPYYQRQQVQDHAGTPPSFPIAVAPQASAPPASVRNQFAPLLEQQKTQEERREHLRATALHAPTQQKQSQKPRLHASPTASTGPRSAPTAAVMPHYQHQGFGTTGNLRQRLSTEQEKQERVKARWRKIGPLIGSSGSRYQRMRLIQQKAWTHPPTPASISLSTTQQPQTQRPISSLSTQPRHSSTPAQIFSHDPQRVSPNQQRQPTQVPSQERVVAKTQVTAAQMAFRATQPTQEPEQSVQTNNIRRQSLRTGSSFAPVAGPASDSIFATEKSSKPARAFAERTQHFPAASRIAFPGRRITGPILTPLPEDPTPAVYPHSNHARVQLPTPEDNGPTIVEDIAPAELPTPNPPAVEDYHHRQNVHVEKRFKLVSNRLINRPRLKIRTHDEPRAQGKATSNSHSGPITLPDLTPLAPGRQPVGEKSSNIPNFPSTDTFAPNPPSHPPAPSPTQGRPRQLPKVTGWGDEDVEAIRGGPPKTEDFGSGIPTKTEDFGSAANLGHGGGTLPSEPPPEETGESGANFGGSIGAPPPGFSEAFGLNGASMPLDELNKKEEEVVEEATTVEEPFFTTRKPKPTTTPPNVVPAVIPENSGLRPAQPPKEFTGGFGSSKGSPFSSFSSSASLGSSGSGLGGSGLGGSGAGFGNSGAGFGDSGAGFGDPGAETSKGKKGKKGRGGKKATTPAPETQYKEEDFFTGDSALVPNNRGPTGDGYGPPVFPGQNVPPSVPASIGSGGEAAGIPPPSSAHHQPQGMMEATENTPTTLRPSALLNILNKADEGFNQMLNNFEQGAPLESALIDIMEVALGSQKLDSQAKILSHLDRTVGLDNLQRLQRWANTGGALDELKEQLVKIAKNYKPPPETNAITIPPEFEYLFKTSG